MKYRVGDKVRVVACENGHGFDIGDTLTVIRDDKTELPYECELSGDENTYWLSSAELEPAKGHQTSGADVASLTLDIPTEAMKEFADHCERAASALERIKAAMA